MSLASDVQGFNAPNKVQNPAPSLNKSGSQTSFASAIEELLLVHYEAKKTLVMWGNSGYGKSSTIFSFAKKYGFDVEQIFCITLDPLTSSMPVERGDKMDFIPNEQLHRLMNATKPTIVLYDELNKFSNPSVENMLNSIFLDRCYNGHKFSDQVLIVGCLNFRSKSTSAKDLDFSIINRATSVLFQPDHKDIVEGMRTAKGKILASKLGASCGGKDEFQEEVMDRFDEQFPEKGSNAFEVAARPMDELFEMIDNKNLSDRALMMLCNGRFGGKLGAKIFKVIEKMATEVSELTAATLSKVVALHAKDKNLTQALMDGCQDFDVCFDLVKQTKSVPLAGLLMKKFDKKRMMPSGQPLLMELDDLGILNNG